MSEVSCHVVSLDIDRQELMLWLSLYFSCLLQFYFNPLNISSQIIWRVWRPGFILQLNQKFNRLGSLEQIMDFCLCSLSIQRKEHRFGSLVTRSVLILWACSLLLPGAHFRDVMKFLKLCGSVSPQNPHYDVKPGFSWERHVFRVCRPDLQGIDLQSNPHFGQPGCEWPLHGPQLGRCWPTWK